ncbi:P22U protein, partial [Aphelenchoides avenae]
VAKQVKNLIVHGKKFYGCVRACVDKRGGSCAKRLGCGLNLPSDATIVQNTKECAIRSGFGTAGVQQLCRCAASAGVR